MILNLQKCLFAVKEAVSGTFNPPSTTALVYASDISFSEVKPVVERAILFNRKTSPKSLAGIKSCELGFKVEVNTKIITENANYLAVVLDLLSGCDLKWAHNVDANMDNWVSAFKEANDATETLSFIYHEGDRKYSIKGGIGDVKISGSDGEIVYMDFTFKAVIHLVETSAFPNPSFEEEYAPVILKDSSCTIAGVILEPVVSFEFALNNDLKERKDFRALTGLLSYYNGKRKPSLTIDPEGSSQLGTAIDTLVDDREGALVSLNIGNQAETTGSIVISGTAIPNQYSREDRDGILAYSLPMDLQEDTIIKITILSLTP